MKRHGASVRMFSSAVLLQIMLSATSLCVGMILIRGTTDSEYGYYVLISNLVLLMSSLQNAYIQPSIVIHLNSGSADPDSRKRLLGGLLHEQRVLLPLAGFVVSGVTLLLWFVGEIQVDRFWLLIAGAAAVLASLYREFYRVVLLAYRRPNEVLRGDCVYVGLLIVGVILVVASSMPAAIFSAFALAVAAIVGGSVHRGALWKVEHWPVVRSMGTLAGLFKIGSWAVAGAATHWLFSQGYNYLVAGVLGIQAVAALAATRLLMMPVNLLSSGISSFLFPTTAKWLQEKSVSVVLRRLVMFSVALAIVAVAYLGVLWLIRDWVFDSILDKQFENRDTLLFLWSVICLLMVFRDQLGFILAARSRFKRLLVVALTSAMVSLSISYFSMGVVGITGALYGLIAGELLSVLGIVGLTVLEAREQVRNDGQQPPVAHDTAVTAQTME